MNFFKKLFGKTQTKEANANQEFSEEQYLKYIKLKEQGLENLLGKMHSTVGHAIISFYVGGAVDMYYFPNHIPGTGFATMELLEPSGNQPKANKLGTYELVAFTKEQLEVIEPLGAIKAHGTPYSIIERRICGIFTRIGNYSFEAILNPGETCELPQNEGKKICLIFDNYDPDGKGFFIGETKHHLLLCMEIFESEMEYSRANGSNKLLGLLKEQGYYPYSDLDREPVA